MIVALDMALYKRKGLAVALQAAPVVVAVEPHRVGAWVAQAYEDKLKVKVFINVQD